MADSPCPVCCSLSSFDLISAMLVSLMSFSLGLCSFVIPFCSPVGFSVLHGGADIYYLVLVLRAWDAFKSSGGIGVFNFWAFPGLSKSENENWIFLLLYYFVYLCECVILIGIIHTFLFMIYIKHQLLYRTTFNGFATTTIIAVE